MYPDACCAKQISSSTCWRQRSESGVCFFVNAPVLSSEADAVPATGGVWGVSMGMTGGGGVQSLVSPSTKQISV